MSAISSSSASWGGHTYSEVEAHIKSEFAGKADLVASATNNHFAALDASGNLKDSGKAATDFATAAQGALADTALQASDITGKANKYLGTITGDGTTTAFEVTHGLDSTFVIVQVQAGASPYGIVDATVAVTSSTKVTVTFSEAPANDATYKVLVIG